MIMYSMQPD